MLGLAAGFAVLLASNGLLFGVSSIARNAGKSIDDRAEQNNRDWMCRATASEPGISAHALALGNPSGIHFQAAAGKS